MEHTFLRITQAPYKVHAACGALLARPPLEHVMYTSRDQPPVISYTFEAELAEQVYHSSYMFESRVFVHGPSDFVSLAIDEENAAATVLFTSCDAALAAALEQLLNCFHGRMLRISGVIQEDHIAALQATRADHACLSWVKTEPVESWTLDRQETHHRLSVEALLLPQSRLEYPDDTRVVCSSKSTLMHLSLRERCGLYFNPHVGITLNVRVDVVMGDDSVTYVLRPEQPLAFHWPHGPMPQDFVLEVREGNKLWIGTARLNKVGCFSSLDWSPWEHERELNLFFVGISLEADNIPMYYPKEYREYHHLCSNLLSRDAAATKIQRAWRCYAHRMREAAARKIQSAWLRAYYDPKHTVCLRRLQRDFDNLIS